MVKNRTSAAVSIHAILGFFLWILYVKTVLSKHTFNLIGLHIYMYLAIGICIFWITAFKKTLE